MSLWDSQPMALWQLPAAVRLVVPPSLVAQAQQDLRVPGVTSREYYLD